MGIMLLRPLRCIVLVGMVEVEGDMVHSDRPMDRLICGDVGFGKTEVAMRAAYRTICNGGQVALLAPTTVLAAQHLRLMRIRMPKVRSELLSSIARRTEPPSTLKCGRYPNGIGNFPCENKVYLNGADFQAFRQDGDAPVHLQVWLAR